MNTKEEIVYYCALSAHKDVMETLTSFDKGKGYKNIYWQLYSQKIGRLLKRKNIPFESQFYANTHSDPLFAILNENLLKANEKILKESPSKKFLADLLNKNSQKEILLETLNAIDFEQCLKIPNGAYSILSILEGYIKVGINKILINDELVEKIFEKNKTFTHGVSLTIINLFIKEGFGFPNSFINGEFKNKILDDPFHSATEYNEMHDLNKKNNININYLTLEEKIYNKNTTINKIKI